MADEVIEAEASPVDPPVALGEADRWLEGQRSKVAQLVDLYRPGEVATLAQYRQAKRDRAALRRSIREVEDQRRGMTKAVKDAVRGFERDVRDLLAPLAQEEAEYKARIDAWEDQAHQAKFAEVQAFYQDMAPALVPLVPFDRLLAAYGEAEKWGAAGTSVEQVEDLLAQHVDDIARDEATIEGMGLSPEDTRDMKAELFSTLNLRAAIDNQAARELQRQRVADLERERAGQEAEAGLALEGESAPLEPAAGTQGESLQDGAVEPQGEEVPPIAFIAYVSEDQRDELLAFCRERGIHGSFRPTLGRRFALVPREG